MCRLVAAMALVASGISALAPPASAQQSRVRPDTFGMGGERLYDLPVAARRVHAQKMAEQGVTFVRREAAWYSIEPEAPRLNLWTLQRTRSYRWDGGTPGRPGPGYDEFVYDLALAGLRWQPVLAYSPRWASKNPWSDRYMFHPPNNNDDFAAFAGALAARYGRNGSFWKAHPELDSSLHVKVYELWNEPNLAGNWMPRPDPVAYGALWRAAHYKIKMTDPTYPELAVIVGSLGVAQAHFVDDNGQYAYRDVDFVHDMFMAHPQMRGAVKGIGYHPYAGQSLGVVEDPIATPASMVRRMRDELVNGVNLPDVEIYITEIGHPTQGQGPFLVVPSDTERGEILYRTGDELSRSDCGVRQYVPHTWLSPESNPADQLDWMGIWNNDAGATGKASGLRYGELVRTLRGLTAVDPTTDSRFAGTVPICAGI